MTIVYLLDILIGLLVVLLIASLAALAWVTSTPDHITDADLDDLPDGLPFLDSPEVIR